MKYFISGILLVSTLVSCNKQQEDRELEIHTIFNNYTINIDKLSVTENKIGEPFYFNTFDEMKTFIRVASMEEVEELILKLPSEVFSEDE